MFFYIFFDSSDQIPSFLLRTVSDFFRFQFCSEKQQNEKKYWFFSVSLELRCVLGFWENHPDHPWFWPNFLERNFNLIWTVSDFPIFYRFQFYPLRWVLHGGPGTGKSYTINLLRHGLFEEVLGWKQGVQYQVVTFQAVMADALEGDTIHHAFGLNWTGNDSSKGLKHLLELSLATLQWRWLIIDEFSMVSAELLAQLERRCREMIRDLSVAKYGRFSGEMRPFGGLNVIHSGRRFISTPSATWDVCGGHTVANVNQQADRHIGPCCAGPDTHMGRKECRAPRRDRTATLRTYSRPLASQRARRITSWNPKFRHACVFAWATNNHTGQLVERPVDLCQHNMRSVIELQRKAPTNTNRRMCRMRGRTRFPSLGRRHSRRPSLWRSVPVRHLDFQHQWHKVSCQQSACNTMGRCRFCPAALYAVARDMASSTVLQEKPDIQRSKIEWLQRHDQECGGLYGILPICLSLPVRSADHLDRRRGILKGCKGKIVGWSIAPDAQIWNKPPEVIYVQFDTAKTWRIEGLPRDNVFPVTAQRKPWFLDRGRKCPRLRITRLQFPLAPGFAITAHVAQGQTLRDGVIADFNISSVASVFTTYVAATRVTGREKLLIMRPFPASPFQKGNGIGRELLLRVWRGDGVDWEALRAKYLEERSCSECADNKGKTAFMVGQWRRGDADRVCRECTARHRDKGEPYQCNVCRFWFSEEAFPTKYRRNESARYRVRSAETVPSL